MARSEKRGEAKRAHVAAAARRLFLAEGFGATSMNAIAREAGVSKETLYAHYAGKEAVLEAALEDLIPLGGRVPPEAAPVRTRAELEERLLASARLLVKELMQPEYLALVRVVVGESGRLPQLGETFRTAVARRALASVAALLAEASERRVVVVDDPELAARMFVGPLLTYVLFDGLLAGAAGPKVPGPARLRRMVAFFLEALPRKRREERR